MKCKFADVIFTPFLPTCCETFCLCVHSYLFECTHSKRCSQPVNSSQSKVRLILQNQVVIIVFLWNLSHCNAIGRFYLLIRPINLYHSAPQRALKLFQILCALVNHLSLFSMVDCCNVEFPPQSIFLWIQHCCCLHTWIVFCDTLKSRKVWPYFFKGCFELECIAESDHVNYYKWREQKLI